LDENASDRVLTKKNITNLRKFSPMVRVLVPTPLSTNQSVSETLFINGTKKYEGSFLLDEAAWLAEIAKATKKRRVKQEALFDDDLTKKTKVKKEKKVKKPNDLRSVFRRHLATVTEEGIKKPWMAEKSFRLMSNSEELRQWCAAILADTSRHMQVWGVEHDEKIPVVAVDTETIGLDTRILVHIEEDKNYDPPVFYPVYEVKIEIAGICLSADGVEGIYIPINHDDGNNMNREECSAILQDFFNKSHLVFYNAKFDREVLKLTMGINMRGYPYFEDVQVLQYINDPKADLGDKGKNQFTGDSGGLKALSESILGIEQVKMDAIGKVKADFWNPQKQKYTQRIQYVPFTWIPTKFALWYAAGDALCTWLLWEKAKDEARRRKLVHHIDHELIDTLAWVERQRYIVADDKLTRSINWHQSKLDEMREGLRKQALEQGWVETVNPQGQVIESFNVDSNDQLRKLLYEIKKLDVVKKTDTGAPSTDKDAMLDLQKKYPDDLFLKELASYKRYASLHPGNLRFDPHDKSARVYLKQCVVAGGRLAASGGDFDVDGGFGLNIQGIKRVEGNWWVRGNVLVPDKVDIDQIEEYAPEDLHKSCTNKDGKQAPGIIKNHIGHYLGYAICLVPKCTTCAEKFGILIPDSRMDANQVVNLRSLFVAPEGWTFFTTDYSNIEMRCAANVSGEPEFIKEFLEGEGDFHALTASKVFPAFNDPTTPKDVKKALRSLAKIINFALLYGGTEYTIYENMKKQKPDITWDECKKMVADYWSGVPVFRQWCDGKQNTARVDMLVETATGRVVKFESAMAALHLHRPTEAENEEMWEYRRLQRVAKQLKEAGNKDEAAKLTAMADRKWRDPDTGVRNALDYQRFMSKIQRVAVNTPLQGLAGDFMRIALNRIRKWANEKEPLVQSVLRLHGSVHDEIDYGVKNQYVPFVIPRVTRLMKLRKYHEMRKWPVPIECDTEYAQSWDVEFHVTGDDGHTPAGWTNIRGMENYLPAEFDMATIEQLLGAMASGVEKHIEKARGWLEANLHERAFAVINYAFKETDPKLRRKNLIAAIQLHEFWTVDGTPDNADETLETFVQFETRCGLTPADRGPMPEMGFLGAVPLDKVRRPTLQILGEEVAPEAVEITVGENTINVTTDAEIVSQQQPCLVLTDPVEGVKEPVLNPVVVMETTQQQMTLAVAPVEDEDPFGDFKMPVVTASKGAPPAAHSMVAEQPSVTTVAVKPVSDVPELVQLYGPGSTLEPKAVDFKRALGLGSNTVKYRINGVEYTVHNVAVTSIPKEFIKHDGSS